MRNYRFTINSEDICESVQITVNNADLLHQIKNVLRLTPESKEEISFIDGSGKVFSVSILEIQTKSVIFKVLNTQDSGRELEKQVVFFTPIIKSDAYSLMVRKLTELGVQEMLPVSFTRSQKQNIVSLEKDNQRQRLNKIIQEATEQCEGAIPAKLLAIQNLEDAIKGLDKDTLKIFASERMADEDSHQNPKLIQEASEFQKLCLLIGPEGGLTDEELEFLLKHGFKPYSLGKRLLKAETAAIALFSSLNLF